MTTKILAATDGTGHSDHAIEAAALLSAKTGAPLTIATVNVSLGSRGPMTLSHSDAEAKAIADKAAATAKKLGAKVDGAVVLTGRDPGATIVGYAEQNGFDHIVTGTGDKHGVSRLVLGSVAGDIAARAHCTVTIAR
ncbi:MAG: universal stress protein [Hyphomicrobiales bacterium]